MKIQHIVIPLIIIGIAIYAAPRIGKSTTVEQDGNRLSITIGKHNLTAYTISNEITDSFLVIGGGLSCGDVYFTSVLSLIPMDTAERLYRTYGDFRQCSSPGAHEGMRSMIPVLCYAENRSAEKTLKALDKLGNDHKDSVIKMTFVQIKITDHTMDEYGETMQVTNTQNGMDAFLVKDIEIIEKDHNY